MPGITQDRSRAALDAWKEKNQPERIAMRARCRALCNSSPIAASDPKCTKANAASSRRGVPFLQPVVETIKQIKRFLEIEFPQ